MRQHNHLALLPDYEVRQSIGNALSEDLGMVGDITSQLTIPADMKASVVLNCRENGVLAGMQYARAAFAVVDADLQFEQLKQDGDQLEAGDIIAKVSGNARNLLTAERVALNFLGHMSGIASQTALFVKAVKGTKASIADTRKTTPGLRMAEKFAVKAGGGVNHRFGLGDAVLVKDNHIAIAGGIDAALKTVVANAGHMRKIEVEVDTLEQLKQVLAYKIDTVLLDNMPPEILEKAVAMIDGRVLAEASGGVNLSTVAAIAATGVDLISVGALTHSSATLDIGLDFHQT